MPTPTLLLVDTGFGAPWQVVLSTAAVTLAAYASVFTAVRVAGRRTLAELSAFDVLVTIAIGTILGSTAVSESVSYVEGLAAIVTLLVLQLAVGALRRTVGRARRILDFAPITVVRDGEVDLPRGLLGAQLTMDDLRAQLRHHGVADVQDVHRAVLEPIGGVSVTGPRRGPEPPARSGSPRRLTNAGVGVHRSDGAQREDHHHMSALAADLWWKNAITYCLDVETFADSNGDGIGDFPGLIEHIDHIASLGATCLWLMPFQPSPNRDDGYDITDHYGVQPALGSLGDVVVLIRECRERGLRVIMDLVVNHTSDQHPWFLDARSSRDSTFRDYYVWRDEPGEEPEGGLVFPDAENSTWALDEHTGQYYLHHFYSHQPDLNFGNPAVRDEIAKIAGFWLELGFDGFRVDAVPYLVEASDRPEHSADELHDLLKELRGFVTRRRGDAMLLGEVNLPPNRLVEYFGDHLGDQMHQLFDFPLMQATHLALARCRAGPVVDALRATPDIPDECQWATFLRNHDELTLDQLDERERQDVFDAFAPDDDMRLFGRGIRRRVPPMLDGDDHRVRMAYSLMLSLRGSPVLFYGEEIGMGEQLAIPGRSSVRTPMQWSPGPTGGFSTAAPDELVRPIADGDYGPDQVNVTDQRRDEHSLMSWMQRMLRLRRETPELGCGTYDVIDVDDAAVLACVATDGDRRVLVVHNLGDTATRCSLSIKGATRAVGLLTDDDVSPTDDDGTFQLELDGYDHRWFRLESD